MASKRFTRRDFLRLSALTAAGAALAGCCPPQEIPTPEQVVVTKVVTEQGEEKIITVVPTAEPMAEPEETATYVRDETLYVSGSAWGPASTWNPFQTGNLALSFRA